MVIALLIKFIYILKIQIRQNINISKYQNINKKCKNVILNAVHLKDFLTIIQILCRRSIKILMSATQKKKRTVLIVFDNMFADLISNKKLYQIVTELFIRGRKLNISNFSCFYYRIIFGSAKRCYTKFYEFFYYGKV